MPQDFWSIVSNSTATQTRICLRTLFRLDVSRMNGREAVNRQNKVTTPIETGVSKMIKSLLAITIQIKKFCNWQKIVSGSNWCSTALDLRRR